VGRQGSNGSFEVVFGGSTFPSLPDGSGLFVGFIAAQSRVVDGSADGGLSAVLSMVAIAI